MKTLILFLTLLFFGQMQAQCDQSELCIYKFILTDAFGDGLNGDNMTVFQNGVAVALLSETISGNSQQVFTFDIALCHDQPFELFWNLGGAFPNETGAKIINPFGAIIYNKPFGFGAQNTTLYEGTANCITTLQTAEFDGNAFSIAPNPATDHFIVEPIAAEPIATIGVYDISGKKVKSITSLESKTAVDISELQRGIYFVEITTKSNQKTTKKIVLH